MRKVIYLLSCFLLSAIMAMAQTRTVSGVVVSGDDGEPLVGASVSVKGKNLGTATNLEGRFVLANIPTSERSLIVAYLGYETQEVTIERELRIVMKPNQTTLGEVVVTAMGISRDAKSLGYSVQEIKSDYLQLTGNNDLTKSLQGKLAGVDVKQSSGMPGASSQIVIRGARSFDGDNTPLYVVDGMPIESTAPYSTGNSVTGSDIANRGIDLDPNDIESINILRGQAAAALYGLRASNGVVVITTKSGKGGAIGKTLVSINQTVSFDRVSRTPDFQTTYAQGSNGVYSPNTSMSWGPKISDLPKNPTYGGDANGYPGKYKVPQLETAGYTGDALWVTPQVYNNWDDYFQTGVTSTTSISVGKTESNGSFSIGLSYTDQEGIAPNTGMDRWNAKATTEKKLSDHFNAGISANVSKLGIDKLSGANDGSIAAVFHAPSSYNLKGIPFHKPGDPYSQISYRSLTFDNPYWVSENNTFNEKTDRFFGNTWLEYNTRFNDDMKLVVKYQLGADSYTTHYQDIFGYGSKGKTGYIDNYGATIFNVNSLLTATYDWKINDALGLNALLGNELVNESSKYYYQYGENFNFGGWNHINNTTTQSLDEDQYKSRTVGFFGSLSLDWKKLLYLTATGRQDYISKMPVASNTFFYPSVSLSLVFTELEAFRNQTVLSFGKIRGSYAEVGQAGTYRANFFTTPSYGGGFWSGNPIVYPLNGVSSYTPYSVMYDPNLKPQNTKTWEVGLELSFLENRVSIDYSYSNQRTVDQIFEVPLAASTGASSLVTNGGEMLTKTHELVLKVTPVKTKDLQWDLNANIYTIDNEVVSLREGVESIMLGGFVIPQVRAGIGYSYPVVYGTSFKKDSQGRILVDEDPTSPTYGMPMTGEEAVIGEITPNFILGGGTTLRYKSVSLGAVFEWKNGGQMYSGSNGLGYTYGNLKSTEDRESTFIFKGYKADGTPNDIVRGGPTDQSAYQTLFSDVLGNIDEAYIFGNSFIKLRELSLRYQLPKINKLNIGLTGFARNILLWTELPNMDPESSQGNNNMMGGFERFSLPQTTSLGFSVDIKF